MVCEAGALAAVSAAIRVGVGIGPMTYQTIPPDCRVLRQMTSLAPSFPVELGLFAQSKLDHPARILIDAIAVAIQKGQLK